MSSTNARQRIDRVAVADPVICDLFIQGLATLEKQLWMHLTYDPLIRYHRSVGHDGSLYAGDEADRRACPREPALA